MILVRKKRFLFITTAVLFLFLFGCNSEERPAPIDISGNGIKKAVGNEVFIKHGSIENIERLDSFVQKVQNKKEENVQLTKYTIEGDPIIEKLNFTGEKIEYTIDTSQDKFGSGEILYFECMTVKKEESNNETIYSLEGCTDPGFGNLLTISHNVLEQDYFGFELKYGSNTISTKEEKLDLDLGNGNRVTISDFQFSTEELNDIYKSMIFANYLDREKKLTNKCTEKATVSYILTVWINSGERHFEWASCDKSPDGTTMTNLVQEIIDVLQNNESYKSLELD